MIKRFGFIQAKSKTSVRSGSSKAPVLEYLTYLTTITHGNMMTKVRNNFGSFGFGEKFEKKNGREWQIVLTSLLWNTSFEMLYNFAGPKTFFLRSKDESKACRGGLTIKKNSQASLLIKPESSESTNPPIYSFAREIFSLVSLCTKNLKYYLKQNLQQDLNFAPLSSFAISDKLRFCHRLKTPKLVLLDKNLL